MRAVERIMVFTICVGFAVYLCTWLGIGGDRIADLASMDVLIQMTAIGIVAAVAAIVLALGISGTEAKVLGSGAKVGDRVGEAAAVGVLSGFFIALGTYIVNLVSQIDYLGAVMGTFLTVMFVIIWIIDISQRVLGRT